MPINTVFIRDVGPLRWAWRTAIRQFYKRILRRNHAMQLPTGEWITLPIADHFASEAFITRADVDWGSEQLLFSFLKGEGVFLDVGAHIGYYSLYMLPRVRAVYAFEPDPRVRVLLEKNVNTKPNIEVIASAVGASEGTAHFTLERHSEVSHLSTAGQNAANQIEVEVTTIDAFVAARSLTVEAIKIDVEGHDTEVIRGALHVLTQQHPIVLTEAKPDAKLFALAASINYRVFAFVRHASARDKLLRELSSTSAVPGETKMLFLVPNRLASQFTRLFPIP
jgi:FkbM family methyltransferase